MPRDHVGPDGNIRVGALAFPSCPSWNHIKYKFVKRRRVTWAVTSSYKPAQWVRLQSSKDFNQTTLKSQQLLDHQTSGDTLLNCPKSSGRHLILTHPQAMMKGLPGSFIFCNDGLRGYDICWKRRLIWSFPLTNGLRVKWKNWTWQKVTMQKECGSLMLSNRCDKFMFRITMGQVPYITFCMSHHT